MPKPMHEKPSEEIVEDAGSFWGREAIAQYEVTSPLRTIKVTEMHLTYEVTLPPGGPTCYECGDIALPGWNYCPAHINCENCGDNRQECDCYCTECDRIREECHCDCECDDCLENQRVWDHENGECDPEYCDYDHPNEA